MFLGHFGVALAVKRLEPKISLGSLFLAVQLADLLWGCFVLLGWEHARIIPGYTVVTPLQFYDYPLSHSLLAAVGWALVAAAMYYSWPTRDTSRHWQAAALVGLAVLSHYLLDVLVHAPDLPVSGNDSQKLGFGLWNNLGATLALELLVFGAGLAIYVAFRSHRHPVRPVRLALLVVVLLVTYFASLRGPLPPSMTVVAASSIGFFLLAAILAGWADQRATPEELAGAGLDSRK
ncbi:MAG: hypothetical protein ACR2HK_03665 [Gemmatimonadales bacterium]